MPKSLRVFRRFILAACCALLVVASASADPNSDKIARLHEKINQATEREGVLTSDIAAINDRIQALRGQLTTAEARFGLLEKELEVYQARLLKVKKLYDVQSERLALAAAQYRRIERRLARRLIRVYEQEQPDTVAILLSAESLTDAFERLDYLREVSLQDRTVAAEVKVLKDRYAAVRARTGRLLDEIESDTHAVAFRASEALAVRDRIASTRDRLGDERDREQQTLASVRESKEKYLAEVAAMEAGSADIGSRLRSSGSSGTPSAAGLIWPVQGTITSYFGMRWGRMHEGIDIGAPEGTPIVAAAGGTVNYAGWEGGYGNLTVIDHGNGLATAYGHQSRIIVSSGQTVAQGQVIGYVGSTGHSTGPHLHFEVRVNGTPVDPLGYL
jgi:murein DD-endopeptidase MepM/ murein hydrolase activator NlpD